ncbi:MAG TPA: hypothetical protein VMB50_19105 [Myxococcales bacterium]|nr:hypothetical protein [Myxococcales bacterium]
MRRPAAALALALAACTTAKPAVGRAPARALTLAYTGDVWGEVGPCG